MISTTMKPSRGAVNRIRKKLNEFSTAPATASGIVVPQERNMAIRIADSAGGGAITPMVAAAMSHTVACFSEVPGMLNISGAPLATCRTSTSPNSSSGCHQVS